MNICMCVYRCIHIPRVCMYNDTYMHTRTRYSLTIGGVCGSLGFNTVMSLWFRLLLPHCSQNLSPKLLNLKPLNTPKPLNP